LEGFVLSFVARKVLVAQQAQEFEEDRTATSGYCAVQTSKA
jgi:hypothetical protein